MCSSISLLTAGIWSATKWPPPASTSKRLGPRRKRRYPRPRADRIVIVAPVVKRGDADRAERRADGAAGAIPCKRGLHGLLGTEHSDVFPSRSRVRRPLSIARAATLQIRAPATGVAASRSPDTSVSNVKPGEIEIVDWVISVRRASNQGVRG